MFDADDGVVAGPLQALVSVQHSLINPGGQLVVIVLKFRELSLRVSSFARDRPPASRLSSWLR
jgi:hypothetical protein